MLDKLLGLLNSNCIGSIEGIGYDSNSSKQVKVLHSFLSLALAILILPGHGSISHML